MYYINSCRRVENPGKCPGLEKTHFRRKKNFFSKFHPIAPLKAPIDKELEKYRSIAQNARFVYKRTFLETRASRKSREMIFSEYKIPGNDIQ